jgi:hypothetical protein
MKTLGTNINGNLKLKNNNHVRYILWNLPACITCPFKTAHCTKCCYARKAERVYKNVLPARTRNYEETLKPDFVENMIYTIEKHLNSKAFNEKLAIFRIETMPLIIPPIEKQDEFAAFRAQVDKSKSHKKTNYKTNNKLAS